MKDLATAQEKFWNGKFGTDYIDRNIGQDFVSSKVMLFANILKKAPGISAIAELGCNVGLNLTALHNLNNNFSLTGFEINEDAVKIADEKNIASIVHDTITEPLDFKEKFDLTFTKNVLIHINPDSLAGVYENLYNLSNRYILICEYYNQTPVVVNYRGHDDRLFKRDFAGEMMDIFDLDLVEYGFTYHRDPVAPQDDVNWFLLEKKS
jgi:pseudaminic acid biosynthesis-associated methylase